jgi:hypothetical protein
MHHRALGILTLAIGLALSTTPSIAAEGDTDVVRVQKQGKVVLQRTTNTQRCALCFTCGGRWPHFGGSIPNNDGQVTEFGSSCASPLTARNDSSPFLCCKAR